MHLNHLLLISCQGQAFNTWHEIQHYARTYQEGSVIENKSVCQLVIQIRFITVPIFHNVKGRITDELYIFQQSGHVTERHHVHVLHTKRYFYQISDRRHLSQPYTVQLAFVLHNSNNKLIEYALNGVKCVLRSLGIFLFHKVIFFHVPSPVPHDKSKIILVKCKQKGGNGK